MIQRLTFSLFFLVVCFNGAYSADFLSTSKVPISCYDFFSPELVYLGATDCQKDKTYALSALSRFTQRVIGLTPEKVTYKTLPHTPNPLYGASIAHIGLLSGRVVAVKKDEPATLYITTNAGNKTTQVFSTTALIGTQEGNPKPIIKMLSTASGLVVAQSAGLNEIDLSVVFFDLVQSKKPESKQKETQVPVKKSRVKTTQKTKTTTSKEESQEDEPLEREWCWRHERTDEGKVDIQTTQLTLTSPQLAIGDALASLGSTVDLHYDAQLKRIYAALQVTSGDNGASGARAIIVGSIVGNQLRFKAIAPDSVFTGTTGIVGARGAHATVGVSKVRTLHTSTGFTYLIALNSGHVYALPLVGLSGDADSMGTLANKESSKFIKPATLPEHTVQAYDRQAQVGGAAVLPGAITAVQVARDAVYVSIGASTTDQASGVFSSQALFDASGAVVAWTDWRRAGGIAEPVESFIYDPEYTFFWYMPVKNTILEISPEAPQTEKTAISSENYIKRTKWQADKNSIQDLVPADWFTKGGVHSVHSFSSTTPSFTQHTGSRVALIAAGGLKSLLLVQTGADNNGLFTPLSSMAPAQVLTKGTLKDLTGAPEALLISGGDLDKVGYISSVEVISDGVYGWLLVGGSNGLAVLMRPNGTGWSVSPGLGCGFSGLTSDMAFKFLGNESGIRKIKACENRAYILSYEKLQRIQASPSLFATGKVHGVTLIKKTEAHPYYLSDMHIAEPYAFVAASCGLLKSGSASSIATAQESNQVGWQLVELPYSAGWKQHVGPVTRLFAVEAGDKSMLYVLNGYVHGEQTRLYRIAFNSSTGEAHLLPDYMYQNGQRGFFASLGEYRTHVVTDGSVTLATRGAQGDDTALLEIWPTELKAGTSFTSKDTKRIVLKQESRTIGRLIYDTTLGTWLIPGEFGIMIHG